MDINELQGLKIKELTQLAQELQVPGYSGLKKQDLIVKILETSAEKQGRLFSTGVLEVMPEGYGFLRSQDYNYLPGPDDIYISPSQIKRFGLRTGHLISGQIRPPKDNERFYALLKVESVNNEAPAKVKETTLFDNLTPLYPAEKINLETSPKGFSMRILDLMAPIGKGQRGL
ncbi:MAG: Rho termination factor N-terminal domain-containing protein, partial [Fidelibacterota bacterium]